MKYIKTYENNKKIYRKNDIVLVVSNIGEFLLPYAKIIRRDAGKAKDRYIDRYYVEILFPNTKHWAYSALDDIHTTFISNFSILRKLTPEEVKELKIKQSASKYNL